jgi:hypothetical protein
MKNIHRLVKNNIKDNYREPSVSKLHNYGGIVALCEQNHCDENLKEVVKKIKLENVNLK